MINRQAISRLYKEHQVEEDFQNADTLRMNDFQYIKAAQNSFQTQRHPTMSTQYRKTYKDFVLEDLMGAFQARAISPRRHTRSRYEQPNRRNVYMDEADQRLHREWDHYHAKILGWKPAPAT